MIDVMGNKFNIGQKFTFQTISSKHGEIKNLLDEEKYKEYIVDLNDTEYLDSSALGFLLLIKEAAEKHNAIVRIINVRNKGVKDVFRIANFDKIFKLEL